MIKVMYIINESALGGAAQSFLDMLTAIKNKVDPVVIIPSDGMIEECLMQMQIVYYIIPFETDYRPIGLHSKQENTANFFKSYHAALQIREIIKQEKVQLVHTNSSVSNVGAIAAIMERIPHIWHIREFLEEDFDSEFVDKELKKELFDCADGMISISECIQAAYKQKYNADSRCIYNGVDSGRFLVSGLSDRAGNHFLLAGNLIPSKGQMEAVKAVNRLVKQGIEVHLYIVGAAGNDLYRWLLKKYVRECGLESYVHIMGFQKDLSKLRQKCGYAIISSRMEALGRVTIEAMLAGCVVIGADTGGTAEVIGSDGSRGYLYKQGSEDDLARVMCDAMEQKEKNKMIRKTAQAYALEMFGLQKYGEKIIGVYDNILKSKEDSKTDDKERLLKKICRQYESIDGVDISARFFIGANTDKSLMLKETVQRWLRLKVEGKSLANVLIQRHIHSAAVYGMGYLGCCLYDELENNKITISYVMDRKLNNADAILKVVRMEEQFPETDAVIITVLGDCSSLQKTLTLKCNCQVLLLNELLDCCEDGEWQ